MAISQSEFIDLNTLPAEKYWWTDPGSLFSRDEYRETVGIFLCKPIYRQAENQYLMVPPEKAKRLSPQAQRLLGYGICRPSLGFMEYQDPMRVLFGVEDEETVDM